MRNHSGRKAYLCPSAFALISFASSKRPSWTRLRVNVSMWWLNWWSSRGSTPWCLWYAIWSSIAFQLQLVVCAPLADAHAEVGLHVEGVRDARRGADVALRERPAEGRAADVLEVVDEFVVRAGVDRVHPEERLVVDRLRVAALGQLRPPEPPLLVVVVEHQQFVERLLGLLAPLVRP